MESDEDELMLNGLMFYHIREKKTSAEKIENIKKTLNQGADINFVDKNNKKNTVLHIAAQKDEKDIVKFLIENGALISFNLEDKTPIHLAKKNNTDDSKEIIKMLTQYGKYVTRVDKPVSSTSDDQQIDTPQPQSSPQNGGQKEQILYPKRAGTSGGSGQFYETKLLSLVLHRALHDKEIEECFLAANIRDVGDFDDVCFRFKITENGEPKHIVCFTQAKHREDPDKAKLTVASIRNLSGNLSLVKYYDSFLKIKQQFYTKLKVDDPMFQGRLNDIDCYFILYTPLKEMFDKKIKDDKRVHGKLHKVINTGDKDHKEFRFEYEDKDIELLTNCIQQERVKVLGKVFLSFILSKPSDMMTNDLIQIYHPALARYVVELDTTNKNNKAKFRTEFFDNDDQLITILRETLYREIVYTRAKKTELSKEEVKARVKEILKNPSAGTISMLIGEVIVFDDKINKLCLDLDKIPRKKYKQEDIREIKLELQKIPVTLAMVKDAVNITGQAKLKLVTFEPPLTFGNLDVVCNQTNAEREKRLGFFAEKFNTLIVEKKEQIKKNNDKNVKYPIVIDINDDNVGPKKTLEYSHLTTKGIGGTVGNLLQFDTKTQMFTFNTNQDYLKDNAKYVLKELQTLTKDDLSNYAINVNMFNFPRINLDVNEYDRILAKEFLNKLWFYTNQANEEKVESILKDEIKEHYDEEKNGLFRVQSDAIFLRFHDDIQKWWKSQSQARYLTKYDPIFDDAKKDIIDSPVLTVLNVMFTRALNKIPVEFNIDVMKSFDFDKMLKRNNVLHVLSDVAIFSAAKIMQSIKYNQYENKYTFINLDYVNSLPETDYSTMIEELKKMKSVTLVTVSETTIDEQLQNTLIKIMTIFKGKIIIITDKPLQIESIANYDCIELKDENVNLHDLNLKSQIKILKECKINYQGKKVPLDTIIDETSKYLIHGKLLWEILNKNHIQIGHMLNSKKYDEIKDYYIHRSLVRDGEEYEVNTLNEIDETIVLITSKPCMGKTTLLTHLSLETKNRDPLYWIVQVNLSAYSNDFVEWQDKSINVGNMMRFLCKAALKKTDEITDLDFIECADKTIVVDSDNELPFQLKLFIHFYNNRKVIFLFDGFDRIYPHHTNEGIELFKALKQANQRMWITSNSYVIHILEPEFGPAYKLDAMKTIQQESFLMKFWKTNLKLEKLNHEQFNNVKLFIDFVMRSINSKNRVIDDEERPIIPLLSIPLHIIYLTAMDYFKNEIHTVSPKYLRETIKQKWGLNRHTVVDHYLREPDEEESMDLAGTPLHMYVAANYFEVQIKEKFDLHLNSKEIIKKANVYLNTITTYERFLKVNLKNICELENKDIEHAQEKARDDFFETHKKLALFAIFKESDIPKILPEPKIREVKNIIQRIESGEIKSPLIDCVVDGIPRFYNLIFAEYFVVEFLTDMLKRAVNDDTDNMKLDSLWDFIVNGILMVCPAGVRNAFDYKLKYDPELIEVASNENCDKIIFDLIVKQNKKAELSGSNVETSLNTAINEGLVNVTNLLLKCSRRYVDNSNVDGFVSILKSGAFVLGAANPSWKELTDNVLHCIREVDGESLMQVLHSDQLEDVSRTITNLCASTSFGKNLNQKIKSDICEPIKTLAEKAVANSSNNENLTTLMRLLPHHLPDIVNSLFGKDINWNQ